MTSIVEKRTLLIVYNNVLVVINGPGVLTIAARRLDSVSARNMGARTRT